MPASTAGCSSASRPPASIAGRSARRARPKLENVDVLSDRRGGAGGRLPAHACAAGRKPRPISAFWRGTVNTVSRALALIEAGAPRRRPTSRGWRNRLGVGERQLRRLFHQHLGRLAGRGRADAAGAARQAVDPRDAACRWPRWRWPSGFGSVRRFNETFQQSVRPSAGDAAARPRRRRAARGRRAVTVRLAYRPPYDWDAMLAFLAPRAIPGVEVVSGRELPRAPSRSAAAAALISVAPARKAPRSMSRSAFPIWRALPQIIARVRRVFDLAADPRRDRRASCRRTRRWRRWSRRGRACAFPAHGTASSSRCARSSASRSPFRPREACRQAGARSMASALARHGVRRSRASAIVFPRPARLAGGRSRRARHAARARRSAVTSLARPSPPIRRIFSRARAWSETIARLRALPGIGEWTAQYIAMRELREPDAFPAADIGLLRAMAGGDGRRPTPAELLLRAEAWRPWRAYAALHLWAAAAHAAAAYREKPHDRQAA